MFLYALTIFVSAFLLFLVQPIIGKQILPWFGGTSAVWSTCLVFFQLALLAGYFYSDLTTRRLTARRQTLLHFALIVIALALLPIVPSAAWKPHGDEQPSFRILLLLAATIGLPYFLLSTTSPLVQLWFARAHPGKSPYRLFALSNLASMVALVGYPFVVEPSITTREQAIGWSVGFGLFAILIAFTVWRTFRRNAQDIALPLAADAESPSAPDLREKVAWIALAAIASSLLLGVSNHLTQNISSIPLLWVIPLALYLLTFIVSFSLSAPATHWYRRFLSIPLTVIALCAMAGLLAFRKFDFRLFLQIGVFSAGLFIACMYCHGELAARRPAPKYLTTFYLMIAIGGALGSVMVGIVAPLTLPATYELGLTVYALALLGTILLWRRVRWYWRAAGILVCSCTLAGSFYTMYDLRKSTIVMARNFYGALRVQEFNSSLDGALKRSLLHGAILHGDQYQEDFRRHAATTYYTTTSGVGIALLQKARDLQRPRRVGLIGLGAGTLAAFGNDGDLFRFYEINPAVVEIAHRDFTYLADTKAKVEIVMGDARLNLEREASQRFDVLAIDAFSGDSIPVHLLTLEALELYEKHMQPDGIIAFHVSNRFLQLHPVVERLARERGLSVAWMDEIRFDGATSSDWILLSKDRTLFDKPDYAQISQPIPPRPQWRMWTDDFNNIFQILR